MPFQSFSYLLKVKLFLGILYSLLVVEFMTTKVLDCMTSLEAMVSRALLEAPIWTRENRNKFTLPWPDTK